MCDDCECFDSNFPKQNCKYCESGEVCRFGNDCSDCKLDNPCDCDCHTDHEPDGMELAKEAKYGEY